MNIKEQMQTAARRGAHELGDRRPATLDFLRRQLHPHGGFRGRADSSDLYYSVFGIGASLASGLPLEHDSLAKYLRGFSDLDKLTFVELASLVRCWSYLPDHKQNEGQSYEHLQHLENYRTTDGGYSHLDRRQDHGTVYGCFLALGVYQDLATAIPNQPDLATCIKSMETTNGGFANDCQTASGLTPATSAALTALHYLSEPIQNRWIEWLMSCHCEDGGFSAHAALPFPDLLSTATTLHCLSLAQVPLDRIRRPCLNFVHSLINESGGFTGHHADDQADCEYTYYGLMSLGYLSLSA